MGGGGCPTSDLMPSASLNGTDLAFWDSGGDGRAVVLSHGFLMNHTMFDA